MSTERQIKANRRNANLSSGPRSARGKSRSSRNARKHGLTLPPATEAVTRWCRIIRGDIRAYPDPLSPNQVDRASFVLAEAEARLERVCQAEALNQEKIHNYIDRRGKKDSLDFTKDGMTNDPEVLEMILKEADDPFMLEAIPLLLRAHPNRPAALRQEARRLARYRREAEAQRHRALLHWIGTPVGAES